MTRIKFCGFTRPQDVVYALNVCAVDAVGFVRDQSSPRYLDDDNVRLFSYLCGPFTTPVSVYGAVSEFDPAGTRCVQGWEYSTSALSSQIAKVLSLRVPTDADHSWKLTEVGQVNDDTSVWHALLLDAYVPGQSGGTGTKVPWDIAADFVQGCRLPVILAGGLGPDNVAEAIRKVCPYGVDVSSGIESSPGVKDHGKMKAFVDAVREST